LKHDVELEGIGVFMILSLVRKEAHEREEKLLADFLDKGEY
jgi:hypothetical protein